LKLTTYTLNEIGGRKNVEDTVFPKEFKHGDHKVFIVCDGVGGSNFGEVASQIAAEVFYAGVAGKTITSKTDFDKLIKQAVVRFKDAVQDFIQKNPSAEGTSTTFTMTVPTNNGTYIAWCGDSRIYQLKNGKILYKTQDHSLLAELVSQGIITEQQAETHPQRNVITKSLSQHTKQADIETAVIYPKAGEMLLMCTDGLLEHFKELEFESMFSKFDAKVDYAKAIDAICRNRTKDNYSMYLLHFENLENKRSGLIKAFVILLIAGVFFWLSGTSTKPSPEDIDAIKVDSLPKEDDNTPLINLGKKGKDTSAEKKESKAGSSK
jgi:serine/threonine protein phosphatase PrpC